MRIDDIRTIQNELDSRIFSLHNTSRTETFEARILALLVELGEFANETRSFKYWSVKKVKDNSAMHEEFSDVMHFVISLGIDIGYDESRLRLISKDEGLTGQLLQMYALVHQFSQSRSLVDYHHMIDQMGSLGLAVGLDAASMRAVYLSKNEKNHHRQDTNY